MSLKVLISNKSEWVNKISTTYLYTIIAISTDREWTWSEIREVVWTHSAIQSPISAIFLLTLLHEMPDAQVKAQSPRRHYAARCSSFLCRKVTSGSQQEGRHHQAQKREGARPNSRMLLAVAAYPFSFASAESVPQTRLAHPKAAQSF